jgi:hypothetical protein
MIEDKKQIKRFKIFGIFGLVLLVALIITTIFMSINQKSEKDKLIRDTVISTMEYAYFEGQKDCLEGDVRITKTDSGWIWTVSPWDSGQEPIYKPNNKNYD